MFEILPLELVSSLRAPFLSPGAPVRASSTWQLISNYYTSILGSPLTTALLFAMNDESTLADSFARKDSGYLRTTLIAKRFTQKRSDSELFSMSLRYVAGDL